MKSTNDKYRTYLLEENNVKQSKNRVN